MQKSKRIYIPAGLVLGSTFLFQVLYNTDHLRPAESTYNKIIFALFCLTAVSLFVTFYMQSRKLGVSISKTVVTVVAAYIAWVIFVVILAASNI